MSKNKFYNIINTDAAIIGGGPAGVAASLQLRKFNIKSLLIEKNKIGGLLRNAWKIENYPGFEKGISGAELSSIFQKQLDYFKCNYIFDEICSIEYEKDKKIWHSASNLNKIISKYIIFAAGTIPVQPDFIFKSNRIFSEYASMSEISHKSVAIVGSGDAAFDYALSLYDNHNTCEILIRNNKFKCNYRLLNEVKQRNIQIRFNYEIENVAEKNEKINLIFQNHKYLNYDYLLYATGRKPNDKLISNNELKNQLNQTIFLAGDLINGSKRQSSISIAQGVKAAMDISDYELSSRII